jgi:hypothetical protein
VWSGTATDEAYTFSGTGWSVADLANLSVGITVNAGNTSSTSAYNVYVNNYRVVVTYTAVSSAPTIDSVSPVSGVVGGGTTCVITGSNFQAGCLVSFGTNPATSVSVVSPSTITCVSPAHAAGAVTVSVTQNSQTGSLVNGYTYGSVAPLPQPSISSVQPSFGSTAGGDVVIISTQNAYANAIVRFNNVVALSSIVQSSLVVLAQTPPGVAGAAVVSVTNIDGKVASSSSVFTYVQPLVLSSISPNFGTSLGGEDVILTGQGFLSGAQVMFGNKGGANVRVQSSTQITVTTPVSAIPFDATVDVTVLQSLYNQSYTLQGGFNFIGTPTITSVVPNTGPVAGGTLVIVNGSAMFPNTIITFNGVPLGNLTFISSTQMQGVTPSGARGYATILATTPGFPQIMSFNTYAFENGVVRIDRWFSSAAGPSLIKAEVYVLQQPCTVPTVLNEVTPAPSPLATIYADPDALVPLKQPILTDGNGHIAFYAPGREVGAPTAADFVTVCCYIRPYPDRAQLLRVSPDTFVGRHYGS